MEVEVNFGNDVKALFPQNEYFLHLQDGKRPFSVMLYNAATARKVGGYISNSESWNLYRHAWQH